MRAPITLLLLGSLVVGCGESDPSEAAGRLPSGINAVFEDGFPFAGSQVGRFDTIGQAFYTFEWDAAGTPCATVYLALHPFWSGSDFHLVFRARQHPTAPIGVRYVDEGHVGPWTIEGEIEGAAYVGEATAESLHLDLHASGALYLTLDARLTPVDHDGPSYAGRVQVEGVDYFFVCHEPEAPRGVSDEAQWERYCAPIREAIAAVPDDPDAPPPPWDPDGDTAVDCGDCVAETAPLPQ